MKKKTGFTLIELLAVIVILAIIALIAVPVIMNILNKSNKSAFKDTAYGILSAGELYFAEQQLELNGMSEEKTFTLPSNELQIKGNVPEGTILKVNAKGETALTMTNGRYCITKGYQDKDITITEDLENCGISSENPEKTLSQIATTSNELEVTSIDTCATSGTCEVGTAFAIRVNEEETYKFYVIADDGKTVTLFMSSNLYEDGNTTEPDVEWVNAADYTAENNKDETPEVCDYTACNDEGPITAINVLNARTSDWNYITAKPYTYSGLDDNGTRKYEDITRTMKARMITYSEANALGCTGSNGSCPSWLFENLFTTGDNNTTGFWTSTANASYPNNAWSVSFSGKFYRSPAFVQSINPGFFSLRPVITLTK